MHIGPLPVGLGDGFGLGDLLGLGDGDELGEEVVGDGELLGEGVGVGLPVGDGAGELRLPVRVGVGPSVGLPDDRAAAGT
jgi:hypothetical protein